MAGGDLVLGRDSLPLRDRTGNVGGAEKPPGPGGAQGDEKVLARGAVSGPRGDRPFVLKQTTTPKEGKQAYKAWKALADEIERDFGEHHTVAALWLTSKKAGRGQAFMLQDPETRDVDFAEHVAPNDTVKRLVIEEAKTQRKANADGIRGLYKELKEAYGRDVALKAIHECFPNARPTSDGALIVSANTLLGPEMAGRIRDYAAFAKLDPEGAGKLDKSLQPLPTLTTVHGMLASRHGDDVAEESIAAILGKGPRGSQDTVSFEQYSRIVEHADKRAAEDTKERQEKSRAWFGQFAKERGVDLDETGRENARAASQAAFDKAGATRASGTKVLSYADVDAIANAAVFGEMEADDALTPVGNMFAPDKPRTPADIVGSLNGLHRSCATGMFKADNPFDTLDMAIEQSTPEDAAALFDSVFVKGDAAKALRFAARSVLAATPEDARNTGIGKAASERLELMEKLYDGLRKTGNLGDMPSASEYFGLVDEAANQAWTDAGKPEPLDYDVQNGSLRMAGVATWNGGQVSDMVRLITRTWDLLPEA